ncbi:MAG: magnesium transporter [Pseudomonadota bacterium]
MINKDQFQEQFSDIFTAIEEGNDHIGDLLKPLHPAEIAFLIESLPYDEQRTAIWENTQLKIKGEILFELNEAIRNHFVEQMSTSELVYATSSMDYDELADILQDMPAIVSHVLLESMETQHRRRLESVLSYPEDSAGGLMNMDTISIRPDISLETVLHYLRTIKKLPDTTDKLFVIDHQGNYLGLLYIADLLTHDVHQTVAKVMNQKINVININSNAKDVVAMFERRDLISAPVVDDDNKLLGRITIDDIVDVIRDEADNAIMGQVGLSGEDDMFAPIHISAQRRAVWLGINLMTALLASFVIGLFQLTIEKLVALAVLMPIVASMGGITGSQTLTIVIRGMALGQITKKNFKKLLLNELAVSLINAILWAMVLVFITDFWFENSKLALVIGFAIVINLLIATLSGVFIPQIIEKFGGDPALGGSVILTTITDVVGFFAFLGLASYFLV